jgi:hypothetical protein
MWALIGLVLAVQFGSELITEPFEMSLSDAWLLPSEGVTVHSWVSAYQSSSECVEAWRVSCAEGVLRVCKQPSGAWLGCSSQSCASTSGTAEQFKWEFVSLTVNNNLLQVCSSPWEARSLACVSVMSSACTLTSTSTLTVTGQLELYDLQFKTDSAELSSLLNNYACYSVCLSCFGPSPNACEEFFPLVHLQTTQELSSTQSLAFSVGDRVFRGRTYDTIEEYALTGWFKIKSSDSNTGTCEVLRFTNSQ